MRTLFRPVIVIFLPLLSFPAVSCSSGLPSGMRPYDGLLERLELQQIVDLQVDRDGAAVAAFLEDDDAAVRARAAFALGSIQDPWTTQALLRLLSDRDPGVRADATFALAQTADSTAAAALLDALAAESDPGVRGLLLEAAGKTGGEEDLKRLAALDLDPLEEWERALAIARFGLRGIHEEAAVELLLDLLASGNPETRRYAAYYFGRMTDTGWWSEHASRIRTALDASAAGEDAVMYLVQALGRLNDPEDTPRLIHRLVGSPDWRIRSNAADALGSRIDDPEVREALLNALDDRSTLVAQVSAGSLGGAENLSVDERACIGEVVADPARPWQVTGALLPIFGRLNETGLIEGWLADHAATEGGASAQGMTALAQVGEESAFGALAGYARGEDPRTAAAAVQALTGRWRRDRNVPGASERYYRIFEEALRGRDTAASYTAAGALADDRFVPLGSVDLLMDAFGGMHVPEDTEPMTRVLSSLGRIGDRRAVPLLRSALAHTTPAVAEAAAQALRRITGEEVAVASDNPPDRRIDWDRLRRYGRAPRLRLVTERGTIEVVLDPSQAPQTCETILGFAEEGAYDGVPFHRVVANFVIQGGDFERSDGFGGPGFAIRSEFTRIRFLRGVIGMASAGKDTEGSQYFITHSAQPHLDGRYTAFGRVVDGIDVVDRIVQGDRVVHAEVVRGG